jgi:hypothetical protein
MARSTVWLPDSSSSELGGSFQADGWVPGGRSISSWVGLDSVAGSGVTAGLRRRFGLGAASGSLSWS